MIVLDIGASKYNGDYSIERLIDMYHPDTLYAFDPSWEPSMAPSDTETKVIGSKKAAWTYDGKVRFLIDGLNGQIGDHAHWPEVRCFDLAKFIGKLPEDEIILKLDAEMSEFELLERLIAQKMDARLSLAIIEWHKLPDGSHDARRMAIERSIACPIEVWKW